MEIYSRYLEMAGGAKDSKAIFVKENPFDETDSLETLCTVSHSQMFKVDFHGRYFRMHIIFMWIFMDNSYIIGIWRVLTAI
ncbi:MAG: hypothetical protein NC180_01825 [Muribaculaceae bacterium]|nr:hypothetical protein [Roseburia sp.]MCM1430687.1 hypothetical protein [Muribaculaceae bacterium]MCM1491954.1 hypothetical protein [Muribaculaceae bacterium]